MSFAEALAELSEYENVLEATKLSLLQEEARSKCLSEQARETEEGIVLRQKGISAMRDIIQSNEDQIRALQASEKHAYQSKEFLESSIPCLQDEIAARKKIMAEESTRRAKLLNEFQIQVEEICQGWQEFNINEEQPKQNPENKEKLSEMTQMPSQFFSKTGSKLMEPDVEYESQSSKLIKSNEVEIIKEMIGKQPKQNPEDKEKFAMVQKTSESELMEPDMEHESNRFIKNNETEIKEDMNAKQKFAMLQKTSSEPELMEPDMEYESQANTFIRSNETEIMEEMIEKQPKQNPEDKERFEMLQKPSSQSEVVEPDMECESQSDKHIKRNEIKINEEMYVGSPRESEGCYSSSFNMKESSMATMSHELDGAKSFLPLESHSVSSITDTASSIEQQTSLPSDLEMSPLEGTRLQVSRSKFHIKNQPFKASISPVVLQGRTSKFPELQFSLNSENQSKTESNLDAKISQESDNFELDFDSKSINSKMNAMETNLETRKTDKPEYSQRDLSFDCKKNPKETKPEVQETILSQCSQVQFDMDYQPFNPVKSPVASSNVDLTKSLNDSSPFNTWSEDEPNLVEAKCDFNSLFGGEENNDEESGFSLNFNSGQDFNTFKGFNF